MAEDGITSQSETTGDLPIGKRLLITDHMLAFLHTTSVWEPHRRSA